MANNVEGGKTRLSAEARCRDRYAASLPVAPPMGHAHALTVAFGRLKSNRRDTAMQKDAGDLPQLPDIARACHRSASASAGALLSHATDSNCGGREPSGDRSESM